MPYPDTWAYRHRRNNFAFTRPNVIEWATKLGLVDAFTQTRWPNGIGGKCNNSLSSEILATDQNPGHNNNLTRLKEASNLCSHGKPRECVPANQGNNLRNL